MLPSAGPVSVGSAILLAGVLLGLWTTGAAILLRVARGDADPDGVRDGAVALGLPIGLALFALPG